jgi:hypothetical protein
LRSVAVFALATIALIFAASNAQAQSAGAGTITGTVEDAAQAVIPGATVTVTNVDTNVVHTYTSNAAGLYTAPFLQPGHYKLSAKATSFGISEAKGVTLLVGQTLTINMTMSVKAETTTVEVEGSGAILDTEKTEVSQVMDQQLVQNLPVNARNWSSFVLLTPGVTQDGGSGLISFHGISGLYNQNYVDGANNNQMLFAEARGRASGAPYVYSVDSIKEFQAETSNYSVQFGQAAGGQVNAITKSGTNSLHGDLFYYLRYPDLNALDPYSKYQALYNNGNPFLLTQPIHQQNQFGGSVGGPLIKDKLFYFLTLDGFRKVGRVLYSDTSYISATTKGVYSNLTNSSYLTPAQCPTADNATYTGTSYITDAQCTNAINFLLNVSNTSTTSAPPSRYARQNLFFPRLDYHVNAKNDAFVDFNWADFSSTNGYTSTPTISNSSPSTNGPTYYHERFLVGGLTTVLSSRSVNQIHAQWGRDLETAGANASGPSIGMGAVTFGMPNALPRIAEPDEHRIQLSEVFSHTMGRHSINVGGDWNNVHEVMINLYQGGGVYSYSDTNNTANFQDWLFDAFAGQTGDTDPHAGYHYYSFVQTVDKLNTAAGTQGKDDFYMNMFDGFAEDNWKVNNHLTVTAGVRYDIQLTPSPTANQVNNNYAPISSQYTTSIKNVMNRVQPRVGFSWSPYVGTVVRGGYGVFSGLNQGSTYYAMRVENGVVQVNYSSYGCEPIASCSTFVATNVEQYPNVPYAVTGGSLSGSLYPTGGVAPSVANSITNPAAISFHGLDPNFVPPYSHEMDLSIEQALPGKLSLTLGYVGTRGMRLPVFVDANLVGQKPHGSATYNVVSGTNNSGTVLRQMTVPVYLSTDRANGLLSKSLNTGFSVANTWYNGLIGTVRRPFNHGLEFVANYTWAHASDDGQVGGNSGTFYGGDVPLDPNNIRGENGLSDTDIRNRFTFSFTYKPEFSIANRELRLLANGFQFSGSEIASGGEPIYASMSGTVSGLAEGGIYGGAISSGTGNATTGRPPQIGRNSQIAPGFNDFDMRASRAVKIHDKVNLQFSVDAFNLLNHTIVTGVNGSYHSTFTSASTSSCATTFTSNPAATGSNAGGCIAPYSGTGLSAFRATSSTNNQLYGPRQLQVAAKFTF